MLVRILAKPCWYTSSKKKKPRVIIEQNCETSRCFVLWFGFSEQRESFSPWRMRRREAPFLQKHPTCAARLSWEQQQRRSLCKLFCCPCCWKEFYELRKARASGAHHAEPGGRCTIKRKRSLYRTMNSTVQKNIYYTHMRVLCLLRPPPRTDFIIYIFQCVIPPLLSWCGIMTGMNNVVCDWY